MLYAREGRRRQHTGTLDLWLAGASDVSVLLRPHVPPFAGTLARRRWCDQRRREPADAGRPSHFPLGLDSRGAVGSPMTSWPMRRTRAALLSGLTPLSGQGRRSAPGIVLFNRDRGRAVPRRRPRVRRRRARSQGCPPRRGTSAPSTRPDEGVIVAANFRQCPLHLRTTAADSTPASRSATRNQRSGNYDRMGVYTGPAAPLGLWRPVTGATLTTSTGPSISRLRRGRRSRSTSMAFCTAPRRQRQRARGPN